MPQRERTGVRNLRYSGWHRQEVMRQYVGVSKAAKMPMIDIDGCEYCLWCQQALLLVETALDNGQAEKCASVMEKLARRADVPAVKVLYTPGEGPTAIVRFRVKMVAPTADAEWKALTPQEYVEWLWSLREDHERSCLRRPQT